MFSLLFFPAVFFFCINICGLTFTASVIICIGVVFRLYQNYTFYDKISYIFCFNFGLGNFVQLCATLGKFGQVWASLGKFGQVWAFQLQINSSSFYYKSVYKFQYRFMLFVINWNVVLFMYAFSINFYLCCILFQMSLKIIIRLGYYYIIFYGVLIACYLLFCIFLVWFIIWYVWSGK